MTVLQESPSTSPSHPNRFFFRSPALALDLGIAFEEQAHWLTLMRNFNASFWKDKLDDKAILKYCESPPFLKISVPNHIRSSTYQLSWPGWPSLHLYFGKTK